MDETQQADEQREPLLEELRRIGSIDLEEVVVRARDPERVLLGEVAHHEQTDETTVVVQLTWRDQSVRGMAQGGASDHSVARSSALATLEAIDQLVPPGRVRLHLDQLEVLGAPSPHRPAVVHVSVALRTASGEELLVGSAVVREDVPHATARAALDAVNRRLRVLLTP